MEATRKGGIKPSHANMFQPAPYGTDHDIIRYRLGLLPQPVVPPHPSLAYPDARSVERKKNLFSLVKRLHIHSLPSALLCEEIIGLCPSTQHQFLFPNVTRVRIGHLAVERMTDWQDIMDPTADRGARHPFTRAIPGLANPVHLCMTAPSHDEHTTGEYFLNRLGGPISAFTLPQLRERWYRISTSHEEFRQARIIGLTSVFRHWRKLETFTYHGIRCVELPRFVRCQVQPNFRLNRFSFSSRLASYSETAEERAVAIHDVLKGRQDGTEKFEFIDFAQNINDGSDTFDLLLNGDAEDRIMEYLTDRAGEITDDPREPLSEELLARVKFLDLEDADPCSACGEITEQVEDQSWWRDPIPFQDRP